MQNIIALTYLDVFLKGSQSLARFNKYTLELYPDFILHVKWTIFWLNKGLRLNLDLYAPDFANILQSMFYPVVLF